MGAMTRRKSRQLENSMPPESASPIINRRPLYAAGTLLAALAAILVVMGLTTRKMADAKLREWTEDQALPVVAIAPPSTRITQPTFALPGRLGASTARG